MSATPGLGIPPERSRMNRRSLRDHGLIPLCGVQEGHEEGNVLHCLQLVSGQLYLTSEEEDLQSVNSLGHPPGLVEGTWGPEPVIFPEVSSQEQVREPEEFFVVFPRVNAALQSTLQLVEGSLPVL
ncbi:hypothetical protein GWK47_053534 [Chionoecetes opilio]|uniref:Uncharacterized protein n=1 Tax=Chionoecetes opilio TaxID=41210 RepID=A0A8J4Y0K3_CHIOP|nr:hypothetical protein GWK47_053534 [Chionoecetes opilio]